MSGGEPRFLADANVARLARRLRMLGYDTLLAATAPDADLVRIALQEERILLTRDRGLARRRIAYRGPLRLFLLRQDDVEGQLRQVVSALGLSSQRAFSQCLECKGLLSPRAKEEVAERVPPYTFQTQEDFMECSACRRVYWRGSHWQGMQKEVVRVAGAGP